MQEINKVAYNLGKITAWILFVVIVVAVFMASNSFFEVRKIKEILKRNNLN